MKNRMQQSGFNEIMYILVCALLFILVMLSKWLNNYGM